VVGGSGIWSGLLVMEKVVMGSRRTERGKPLEPLYRDPSPPLAGGVDRKGEVRKEERYQNGRFGNVANRLADVKRQESRSIEP